jgi:DNA-binding response OmpR family regulator
MNRLRKLERACFEYLQAHSGQYVSREELLERVWDVRADLRTRRVDAAIANIRKVIGYQQIESRNKLGYRAVAQ